MSLAVTRTTARE